MIKLLVVDDEVGICEILKKTFGSIGFTVLTATNGQDALSIVNKEKPKIVFVNYFDDTHQDHRVIAQASASATRYIKEVLYYEVPTSQNFQPDIFVDIAGVLDKKLELLKIHASQIDKTKVEDLTILESVRSCAIFRGYQGRVKYAEGFKAIRIMREI